MIVDVDSLQVSRHRVIGHDAGSARFRSRSIPRVERFLAAELGQSDGLRAFVRRPVGGHWRALPHLS